MLKAGKKGVGILHIRKHTARTVSTSTRKVQMTKQAKTLNERELQRLLDFVKTTKRSTNTLRRIFICQFSAIGIGLGVMLLLQGIPVGTKLLALSAIAASAFALKREFKRK